MHPIAALPFVLKRNVKVKPYIHSCFYILMLLDEMLKAPLDLCKLALYISCIVDELTGHFYDRPYILFVDDIVLVDESLGGINYKLEL